jgi:hypothetical protein
VEALPLPQLPPSPPREADAKKGRKKARTEEGDAAAALRGITVDVGRPVSATYTTKQLVEFTKGAGLSKMVAVGISRSIPMRIRYDVPAAGGGDADEHGDGGGFVAFFLAPRSLGGEEEAEEEAGLVDFEAQEAAAAGFVAAPAGAEPEDE